MYDVTQVFFLRIVLSVAKIKTRSIYMTISFSVDTLSLRNGYFGPIMFLG